MRFGKLLAALTQNSRANEPYISYKELKHNLSKVFVLCGGKEEAENSSGDDGPLQQELLEMQAASSSSSAVAASSSSKNPRIVVPQQDFFSLLDQDLTAVKLYVQSNVSGIEAMIGEWQVAAVKASLIFTPQQLEEVQRQLPVHMEEEALVEWLLSLTPGAKTRAARFALVEKYSEIARLLNSLLQHVEVNLTAVRKILKKFDKKIPPEFKTQKGSDYKVHHELFTPAMQHVLVTAVQMQRLVAENVAESGDSAIPISQLGPESLAVLSCVQNRNVAVEDVFGYPKPGKIDVYAKPMTVAAGAAAATSSSRPSYEPSAKAAPGARQPGAHEPSAEEEDDDEAPEGQEPVASKSRRRGGRNNRKRGSRRDSEKSEATQTTAQPPQGPQGGKGKAKGQARRQSGSQAEAQVVSAGPLPCGTQKVEQQAPRPVIPQQIMQMPYMQMDPRMAPIYGGLPVFVPKAAGRGANEPMIIGGPPGTVVDATNWISMPMMWPQGTVSMPGG